MELHAVRIIVQIDAVLDGNVTPGYKGKRNGPRIDSWRMPYLILIYPEESLFALTK